MVHAFFGGEGAGAGAGMCRNIQSSGWRDILQLLQKHCPNCNNNGELMQEDTKNACV